MKHFLVSLLAIAVLAACSKNDDDTNGNNSGGNTGGGTVTSTTQTPTTQTPTVKKITETTKIGQEQSFVMNYYYDEKGRSSVSTRALYVGGVQSGTAYSITSFYEGDNLNPSRLKVETGGIDDQLHYYFYNNDQLIRIESNYKNRGSEGTATTTYSYYPNGFLSEEIEATSSENIINGVAEKRTLYKHKHITYDQNVVNVLEERYVINENNIREPFLEIYTFSYTFEGENIIKKVEIDRTNETVYEYAYDNYKNPYLNNQSPQKITEFTYLVSDLTTRNNVTKITKTTTSLANKTKSVSHETFEYTYNKEGYPTIVKHYQDGQLISTKEYEYY